MKINDENNLVKNTEDDQDFEIDSNVEDDDEIEEDGIYMILCN